MKFVKFLILFAVSILSTPLFAARCLQALVLDPNDRARAQLVHLENTGAAYRATHNIPQIAEGSSSVEVDSVIHPLPVSMATGPAAHFFFNAHRRGIVTDREVAQEMLRLSKLPPARGTTFVSGDWMNAEALDRAQQAWQLQQSSIPPIPIATRMAEQPYFIDPIRAASSLLNLGINSMEFLIPKNLLTVTSAQSFVVGQGVQRIMLPWQTYKEHFKSEIPPDVLAFESGKASAEDRRQFPEMLHAASFLMLKEAVALSHPLSKVINYVHSPDAAHHRLYELWGLHPMPESIDKDGHRLYFITLEEMLTLPRFDPAQFSERIALTQKHSEQALSAASARFVTKMVKELMSLYLDANFAPLGKEGSRIRIDDRSPFFYTSAEQLLNAYGITRQAEAYKAALNKIKTARFLEKKPEGYLPEEFEAHSNQGNVFIQELSDRIAHSDPAYLAKALAAVSRWYLNRISKFAKFNPNLTQHIVFNVITESPKIVEQAKGLGLSVQPLMLRPWGVVDHQGNTAKQGVSLGPYYAIRAPLSWVSSSLSTFNGHARVEQGHWAIENELRDPIMD